MGAGQGRVCGLASPHQTSYILVTIVNRVLHCLGFDGIVGSVSIFFSSPEPGGIGLSSQLFSRLRQGDWEAKACLDFRVENIVSK